MNRCKVLSAALSASLWASVSFAAPTEFWSGLTHDGPLAAGWVEVLPVLSSACNARLNTTRLNETLIKLSEAAGNVDYARDLYVALDKIENKQSQNQFVADWNIHFHGDQKAACETASQLWGSGGTQFAGILDVDVSLDATGSINENHPNKCK